MWYDNDISMKEVSVMDQEQKLISLLESIEKTNRKQATFARLQMILSIISVICCIVLLIAGLTFLPKIQAIVTEAEKIVNNMEALTTELAKTEFTDVVDNINSLVSNVDELVATSQQGVEQTMSKINAIDFDALNSAIEDLSNVIEPLAKVVKRFSFG